MPSSDRTQPGSVCVQPPSVAGDAKACRPKIMLSADGTGILSQAGSLLLTQALRVTGLDRGLDAALERWRPRPGGA